MAHHYSKKQDILLFLPFGIKMDIKSSSETLPIIFHQSEKKISIKLQRIEFFYNFSILHTTNFPREEGKLLDNYDFNGKHVFSKNEITIWFFTK